VQKAVAWVLSAVYEQDFLECSYGFRPGRKAHDALHRITEALDRRGGRWVVEVDIEGYFDTVNHEWLRKVLRHRTNDGGLIRLVGKWLNAGVLDQGVIVRTDEGVPQGGPVSPVLANIYLHYVLDLWFGQEFQRRGRGYAELIRYADDVVAVFANQEEAERFRREVEGRLGDFGLRISPEKTVMVPFDGRNLQGPSGASPKPGGFTFLGFVHYRTKARRGQIVTARKPSAKSRERFLAKIALGEAQPSPTGTGAADLSGAGADRALPLLWTSLVHRGTEPGAVAGPTVVGEVAWAAQSEGQAQDRLGDTQPTSLVPASDAPSGAWVGLVRPSAYDERI
jgi:RNA-directed DNA polymerase